MSFFFETTAISRAVRCVGMAALGIAFCLPVQAGENAETGGSVWSTLGAANGSALSAATDQVIVKYKSGAARRMQSTALQGANSTAAISRLGVAMTHRRAL